MTATTGETAASAWTPLAGYLELDYDGSAFSRDIDATWVFLGRVFGGYGAALMAAAAMDRSKQATLVAANVTFLRVLEPGRVEIEVEEMHSGNSAWAGRTVLRQGGQAVLFGDMWFGPRDALPVVDCAPPPPPGTPPIQWFLDAFPFMTAFEELALDYPTDPATDPEPLPRVTLAARPHAGLEVHTERDRQLYLLMFADAHMMDAAVRPHGMATTLGVSHNLAVQWAGIAADDGWLEFEVEAIGEPPFSTMRGEIRGAGAIPVAWILQQGRVRPDTMGLMA